MNRLHQHYVNQITHIAKSAKFPEIPTAPITPITAHLLLHVSRHGRLQCEIFSLILHIDSRRASSESGSEAGGKIKGVYSRFILVQ